MPNPPRVHSGMSRPSCTAFALAFLLFFNLSAPPATAGDESSTEKSSTEKPSAPLDSQAVIRELVEEAAGQVGAPGTESQAGQPSTPAPVEPSAPISVEQMCIKIGAKLGSVNKNNCMERNLGLSGARSVNGLPILVKEYPPLAARRPRARILLLGGIHGDEYSSVSIVFKWMQVLDRHHSGLFHWRIAPLVNPDGLLRRQSVRMNANGVDLNRNFPTADWRRESNDYWVRETGRDPRRFPGPSPLSEPESRWVAQEIERFRPHAIVSIHAPFGLLDFDGPPTTPPERLGQIFLSPLGTYPGSLGRFVGIDNRTPIITIELPYAGIMPTPEEISSIWTDLVRWLATHLRDRERRGPDQEEVRPTAPPSPVSPTAESPPT